MEQSFFSLLFVVSFIIFLISIFYKSDYQLQGVMAGISFVFFAILSIQSLNIQVSYYDPNTNTFVYDRLQQSGGLEFFVPLGICLVLMIFSLLNVFILFTYKAFDRMINQKPMNIGNVNGDKKGRFF